MPPEPVFQRPRALDAAPLSAIDETLRKIVRSDGPGLVVGVAQAGTMLYRSAFGMASVEHSVPLTPGNRMRIASTTKQFTCLAVMLLAEDGLLSIDAPVYDYLPQLKRLGGGPTLRQLMNHTGGWRCHQTLSSIAHGLALEAVGTAMPMLVRQQELNFEPGSQMIYSNGGYLLLSAVIERMSGLGFGEFLLERIFEPLRMTDTRVVKSDFEVCQGLASRYLQLPGGLRHAFGPSQEGAGDGAIVSTVDDMLRWTAHLRGAVKQVGSLETWRQMTERTTLSSGTEIGYGLGLMVHPYRGVEVIHHAGGTLGAASQMLTVPAHELDIVVLSNGSTTSPVSLGFQVLDALLEPWFAAPAQPRARAVDHAHLIGARYHSDQTGLLIGFQDVGGQLGLSWLGSAPIALRAEPGRLWLETEDIALSPIELNTAQMDREAAPDGLLLLEGGQPRTLRRLVSDDLIASEVISAASGEYFSQDLDATASLCIDPDHPTILIQDKHGRHELEVEVLAVDLLEARSLDPLMRLMGERGAINLERDAMGQVQSFRIDVGRARHLGFVRTGRVA